MIMLNKQGLCQWEIDLEFLRVESNYCINCFFTNKEMIIPQPTK